MTTDKDRNIACTGGRHQVCEIDSPDDLFVTGTQSEFLDEHKQEVERVRCLAFYGIVRTLNFFHKVIYNFLSKPCDTQLILRSGIHWEGPLAISCALHVD